MIERKTMLDQVELTRAGTVNIRLALLLVEGDNELHTQYHRASIDPTGDVVAQMAVVVAHLGSMGYPPLPESALGLLRSGHQLIKDYLGFLPGTPDLDLDLGHGGDGGVDPADGAGDPGEGGMGGDVERVVANVDSVPMVSSAEQAAAPAPDVVY